MSGLQSAAPDPLGSAPDPLAALRASDRRPRAEVFRERLTGRAMTMLRAARRPAIVIVVAALAVGIGWRLFAESQPPVEASIPLATGDTPAALGAAPVSTEVVQSAPSDEVDAILDDPEDPVATPVVVHVAGAVARPGIIRASSEWRVDDAVREAGGAVPTADLDRINLAAPILDGQRIFVPHVDEDVPPVIEPESAGASVDDSSAPINLNTASVAELQTLPGVGPATATAIVDHRDQFGSFGTVDSLISVTGIGPATLESLRDRVRV